MDCLKCGIKIKKPRQKYCSYECYWNSKRNIPNPNHSKILKKLFEDGRIASPKGMLNKHHSSESKERIRLGNIGKVNKHSKQGIESIRMHMKERAVSDETKKKLSETRKRLYREGILINPMLGKKRPDVSQWMRTESNIRKFVKRPSKPQIEMFRIIKNVYKDAILEYPIKINNNKTMWLDVAVPSLKIDFEFDGTYWHKDQNKDILRDNILKSLGWYVVRVDEKIMENGVTK